jgi:hypothetical protein
MRTLWLLILSLASIAGCSSDADGDLPDLALDHAKADSASPTAKLPLRWHEDELETIHPIAFERLVIGVGQYQPLVYTSFEVSGPSTIELETEYHATARDSWNDINRKLDTLIYVFQPTAGQWGDYLDMDDDSGWAKYSKLTIDVDAGEYRVLLRLPPELEAEPDYSPIVDVRAACAGECL